MIRILIAMLAFTASCSSLPRSQDNRATPAPTRKEFQLHIRKDTWEPIFFEAIDERAKLGSLKSLRSAAVSNDDLEIRVWRGFGLTPLAGFVLKRVSAQWSALFLAPTFNRTVDKSQSLSAPKSGWDACWRRLQDAGILILPDAHAIGCSAGVNDGMSYVVEYNYDGTYRTYLYDNPGYAKCDEAKRMIALGNLISEEFGVPEVATK